MRKIIIMALMAATVMPAAAMAQPRAEVRRGAPDVRAEQREVRDARRPADRRDVREAKREHREDWRDYRRANRAVYARGNWNAPFRYREWQPGVRIQPVYYSSRYYIANPHRYRLPAPGRNLRWVRHYDDVLLVNVRTGRVVQVHRNFFW